MKTTRSLLALALLASLARADLLPPVQDSSSSKGKLSAGTGRATTLPVTATRKGFVLFNLSDLPADVQPGDIANARLRIYLPRVKTAGDIAVHTVAAAWDEVTTAPEPGVSAAPVAMFPAALVVKKKFLEVDVTATVQAWRAAPATNLGFAFLAAGTTNLSLGAKEGSGSGYPCELEVQIDRATADGSVGSVQLADGSVTPAKLASGLTLGGTTTGTFSGPLAGNVTGNVSGSAATFTGMLAGNVTGPQGATVVATVGGVTAANVATGANLANAATDVNTASTIVKRDGSGRFAASGLELPATSTTAGFITQGGTRLLHTFGTNNFFAGVEAGNFTMTGAQNTASGRAALSNNTTGNNNTATGRNALLFNTTGSQNTASGESALANNTEGSSNTASGQGALSNNTMGNNNTASGLLALFVNMTGSENTASGDSALFFNTEGNFNTASGRAALANNTTGSNNTASGKEALNVNTTGSNNTALGHQADVTTSALNNATAIGAGAKVDADNKVRIGNTAVTVIEGQVAFTFTSDRTKKENFVPVDGREVLEKIRGFELTSWNYTGQDAQQFRHYGVMAQDFHAAFGHDAVGTVGTPTTVNSGDMAGVMMSAIKELATENAELKKRLERLEALLGK